MKRRHILPALAALLLASCGESLFDTYKDMAGDGEIRYVGKVSDLTVSPGWQHITVTWKNNVDPIISQVKVRWSAEDVADSVYLPAGTDNFDITNLTQGTNYEVDVMSVDKDMNASEAVTAYTRPFNSDHELVRSFTTLVSRSFFLHDHLLLTFIGWDSNVTNAYITYTKKSTGEEAEYQLTRNVVRRLHADVPDVDGSKPVYLYRTGRIQDCPDVIVFPAREIDNSRMYSSEFKTELKRQFGYEDTVPDAWSESVTSLDLDWGISDLADLLYLPNLKSLYLGRGRYVREDQAGDATNGQSQVVDAALSNWVLQELHDLNGLQVYRYDKHFSGLASADYITDMGHHDEPDYTLIDMKGAKVTMSPAEDEELTGAGWSAHEEYLVDGDAATLWSPYPRSASVTYTLTIELDAAQRASGLRLVQSYYDDANARERVKSPSMIRVYTSENGLYFPLATNIELTTIGASTGEVNYIKFSDDRNVKAVRIELTTPQYYQQYAVSLAEIGLYRQ